MNTQKITNRVANPVKQFSRFLVLLLCVGIFVSTADAQQTAGGTQIQNQATATYSDGNGNNFSTVSNTVTVTVSNVSGLTITPDAGNRPSIVAGQTNALFTFRVTNTGNFADQVRFLANGQSMQITGSGVISAAVIDVDASGTVTAGDTNIFTNPADVISASILQNGFVDVIVSVNVAAGAIPGSSINVQLGDATTGAPTYDNQPAGVISAHEVRTVSTSSVNGLREARGDMSAAIDTDVMAVLSLTAPAGPVALGSDINYSWQLCNNGQRASQSITLVNAPGGSNTGVFIIAPIPVGTALKSGQTFPAGTLYTTSPLSVTPLLATYTTTAPADLTTVRRMAFRVGATLAATTCSSAYPMLVTITTTDATNDIYEIGDAFTAKFFGGAVTDQSGDAIDNIGDGNANFNEGGQPGHIDGDGIQQITLLIRSGSGLIGPLSAPTAVGPTNNNNDYSNRSVTTGIAGIPFGGVTSASGTIVYTNTVRNTGNANDTFVLSVPTIPAGFTVEISVNGGGLYTPMTTSNSVNLPVAFASDANILVRVTAPAGTAVLAASGFAVVVRATSAQTPASFNETIDRLYTGFLRMTKTAVVTNGTGVGGPTDPVPGAVIEYTVVYNNLSSTGGTGNIVLNVANLVITENGNVLPNNWGSTTDQVVGSASDTLGGVIVGDAAGSVLLTNTVSALAPQASGTFKFRRVIR
jgi:hypothetical protein